jgi:regulator of protease activity HflC (stomatin/prohibitin superfamily)
MILGLQHLQGNYNDFTCALQMILDEATDPWGVKVERVEV